MPLEAVRVAIQQKLIEARELVSRLEVTLTELNRLERIEP